MSNLKLKKNAFKKNAIMSKSHFMQDFLRTKSSSALFIVVYVYLRNSSLFLLEVVCLTDEKVTEEIKTCEAESMHLVHRIF